MRWRRARRLARRQRAPIRSEVGLRLPIFRPEFNGNPNHGIPRQPVVTITGVAMHVQTLAEIGLFRLCPLLKRDVFLAERLVALGAGDLRMPLRHGSSDEAQPSAEAAIA